MGCGVDVTRGDTNAAGYRCLCDPTALTMHWGALSFGADKQHDSSFGALAWPDECARYFGLAHLLPGDGVNMI